MQNAPQNPHFTPIRRNFYTEDELNTAINVVKIKVYGKYTLRGEHRKEIIEADYETELEVPENFNKGHIKLSSNRYVRKVKKGIRVRTFNQDMEFQPEPLENKRRVRDFISEKGMRDNARAERRHNKEMRQRKAEADSLAAGNAPQFIDNTSYDSSGLPPISDKEYLSS